VRYSSKIADINLFHLYFASPLEVTPLEFHQDRWCHKTRVRGVVSMILH